MSASMADRKPRPTAQERFWSRVEKTDSCWNWIGTKFTNSGYGRFKSLGRDTSAHIFSWEWDRGPVPDGLQLDHLCRNRACVNPSHLEPVTGLVNQLRGDTFTARSKSQTHCKRGHPLSGDNLFIRADGHRRCQACERACQARLRKTDKVRKHHAEYERESVEGEFVMKRRIYRQGDVLIMEAPTDVALGQLIQSGGRIVLAHGEVTNHSHAIRSRSAQLFESPQVATEAERVGRALLADRILALSAPATLRHEEHAAVKLPAGRYVVRIQRHYEPGDVRNVAD